MCIARVHYITFSGLQKTWFLKKIPFLNKLNPVDFLGFIVFFVFISFFCFYWVLFFGGF